MKKIFALITILLVPFFLLSCSGAHDELLADNGYYARLYGYQNHTPVIRALETPVTHQHTNSQRVET